MQKHPNHTNRVKITAGTHRSRYVKFKGALGLRPTAEAVREKLFNWLGQYLYGKKVLDLFSGSGILSFESASRGARYVVSVESNFQTCEYIRKNCKELEFFNMRVIHQDVIQFLKITDEKFDVIFLDPPYDWDRWEEILVLLPEHLKKNGVIYLESNREIHIHEEFVINKTGKSGQSRFCLAGLK